MNYVEAREQIRSGDLLSWSHRGWGSLYDIEIQIVRMATRSEYCHVGIAWCIGGRVFVLEAVQAGVRIFPLSRLIPFYWIPLDLKWTEIAEAYALSKVGARYSKWQAILAGLGILKVGKDEIWQCAEYAGAVLTMLLVRWLEGIQPTPSNVVAAAQGAGKATYLIT